jgi:hypothetical protein
VSNQIYPTDLTDSQWEIIQDSSQRPNQARPRVQLIDAGTLSVPMAGHGTTGESKCAQDIAHTFFLYPDAELDTSCVEAFRPVFVLPGDALPAAAE